MASKGGDCNCLNKVGYKSFLRAEYYKNISRPHVKQSTHNLLRNCLFVCLITPKGGQVAPKGGGCNCLNKVGNKSFLHAEYF